MKLLILLLLPIQIFARDLTKKELQIYLCIGSKVEYEFCIKKGLGNCAKSQKYRYYQDLNCKKTLGGLNIRDWSPSIKKRKFKWEETCKSVANEYSYCKKQGIKRCANDMKKRYEELWCQQGIDKELIPGKY